VDDKIVTDYFTNGSEWTTTYNSMFLQWCRDELV